MEIVISSQSSSKSDKEKNKGSHGESGWPLHSEIQELNISETEFLKEVIKLSKVRSRKRLYSEE